MCGVFIYKVSVGHGRCSKPAAAKKSCRACESIIQPTTVGGFMLRYAVIFFIIAIIAAFFGFGGIATGAAEIAKILFFIFIVIFLATLLLGVFRR
jgi:uncharacterized membrane protein YtjA (UPF0391 family)